MQHNYIGTEHLLLGLVGIGEGVAYDVLREVSIEALRQWVRDKIGEGPERPSGHIPFTPRSVKVLEIAGREAIRLNHNYVGTEHVLLGIVREKEGVGWQMLAANGFKAKALRASIETTLATYTAMKGTPSQSAPEMKCSFCGKLKDDVKKLIAGPGVYICEECVALSVQILSDMGEEVGRPDVAKRLKELEERITKLEDD